MSDTTTIEWTRDPDGSAGATWNPVTGCQPISRGCDLCYARTFAERWRGIPGHPYEQGFDVRLWPERLDKPRHWRRPRRVFVNSMSDLFHTAVPDEFIGSVFETMAATPQHTYLILTKRHGRMRSLLKRWADEGARQSWAGPGTAVFRRNDLGWVGPVAWPLPNVWVGVSVEDQQRAALRIPTLLDTPASVRWLSCEPLLGSLDLTPWMSRLDWVVVGGESGARARPMHPAWPRRLRDDCQIAGVPFFYKQAGQYAPVEPVYAAGETPEDWDSSLLDLPGTGCAVDPDGTQPIRWTSRAVTVHQAPAAGAWWMLRLATKAAGRDLDGQRWEQMPEGADR